MTNKCTQLFHKLSHCYMFRHSRVILRQPAINTLPSYTSISNAAVGITVYNYDVSQRFYVSSDIIVVEIHFSIYVTFISYYFALWPTNAQLFHKLSHCHMFRHSRVTLRQPAINTLPSYTSISNAAVGNTVYNQDVSQRFYASSHYSRWNLKIIKSLKY